MNSNWRRIFSAATLSIGVWGLSWVLYQSSLSEAGSAVHSAPVASIGSVKGDVNRRPAARLIWQKVSTGEALYAGEAIRTSSKGQVRIHFPGTERYLDLDPDSLIVINFTDKEIALDLMDGSLLVKGDQAGTGPALTMSSSKGKVDLSGTVASLSKSGRGIDLTVHQGQAVGADGRLLGNMSEDLNITSPLLDHPWFVNTDDVEPIHFAWAPHPQFSSQVAHYQIWLGDSVKNLGNWAQTSNANLTSLDKKVPSGLHFFQILAVDTNGNLLASSHVHRLEVIGKRPPGIIAPMDNAEVVIPRGESPINFKWSRSHDTKSLEFELAKDAHFEKSVKKVPLGEADSIIQNLTLGEYYWRLSANFEGMPKAISTKAFRFIVTNKSHLAMNISWKPHLEKQEYLEAAKISLAWSSDHLDQVKNWRVRVWPEASGRDPASTDEHTTETKKLASETIVPKAGKYFASVEAVNENDVVLAKSEVLPIELSPTPAFPAPEFLPKQGRLQSDPSGSLKLDWTTLEHAREYHVQLRSPDGTELKAAVFKKNQASLANLMPGQYQVTIFAIDQYGRETLHGAPRQVLVPDDSGLQAPVLKKVQVH